MLHAKKQGCLTEVDNWSNSNCEAHRQATGFHFKAELSQSLKRLKRAVACPSQPMVMISNSSSAPQWFALRVRSNREKVTALALNGKGYEVFLPTYQKGASRRSGPSPLFPGYLFTLFDLNDRLPILVLPGVVHIVGLGKSPAPIDPAEIESLRIVVEAGLPINPAESFTVGQKVRIEQGPLASAYGVIAGVRSQRLIVTISLLQRSVSVELQPEWISPVHSKSERADAAVACPTPSLSATLFQTAKS